MLLEMMLSFANLAMDPIVAYFADLAPLLSAAMSATKDVLCAYWVLLHHIFTPLAHFTSHVFKTFAPMVSLLMRRLVMCVVSQPRHVLLAELLTTIAIMGLVIIARRLHWLLERASVSFRRARSYLLSQSYMLQRCVRDHYMLITRALPHVFYVAGAASAHYMFISGANKWSKLTFLSIKVLRTVGLVLTAFVWPASRSIQLLYGMPVDKAVQKKEWSGGKSTTIGSKAGTNNYKKAINEKEGCNDHVIKGNSLTVSSKYSRVLFSLWCNYIQDNTHNKRNRNSNGNRRLLRHRRTAVHAGSESDTASKSPTLLTTVMSNCRLQGPICSSGSRSFDSKLDKKNNTVLRASAERQQLSFWIVMAMVWALRCMLHFICPSILVIRNMLNFCDVCLFHVVMWAQLRLTNGADILYALLAEFMRKKRLDFFQFRRASSPCTNTWVGFGRFIGCYGNENHKADSKNKNNYERFDPLVSGPIFQFSSHLETLLRIASSLRIVDAIRSCRLWRFLIDSGLAIGLFFMFAFTPRPLTFLATILAGIVWPCIRSARAIECNDNKIINKAPYSDSAVSKDDHGHLHGLRSHKNDNAYSGDMRRQNWICYWTVYAFLEIVHIALGVLLSWVPLLLHIKMAAIVWLQADGFAGTFTVINWFRNRLGLVQSDLAGPLSQRKAELKCL